jgi:hypothetical protein
MTPNRAAAVPRVPPPRHKMALLTWPGASSLGSPSGLSAFATGVSGRPNKRMPDDVASGCAQAQAWDGTGDLADSPPLTNAGLGAIR